MQHPMHKKRVPADLPPRRQRNLPAYLAQRKNMGEMLEDGTLPDPLYGSYQLIPQQRIVMAFQEEQQRCYLTAFTTEVKADARGVYSTRLVGERVAAVPAQDRQLAVVIDDFDNDGREETAAVYERAVTGAPDRLEMLVSKFNAQPDTTWQAFNPFNTTLLDVASVGQVALTSGHFTASSSPMLVLGWADSSLQINLQLYEVTSDLAVIPRGAIADERLAEVTADFAIERGDVNGDGLDELVLTWRGPGDLLYVKVYVIGPELTFIPKPRSDGEPTAGERHLALAVSDYNYDANDEIAVAWERTEGQATLRLFAVSDDLSLIPGGSYTDTSRETALYSGSQISVTATEFISGALLAQEGGVVPSQIVLGYEVKDHAVMLRLFQTDKTLGLDVTKHMKATRIIGHDLPYGLAEFALKLKFGHLAAGALNSVVVSAIGVSNNPWASQLGLGIVSVGIVQVAEDLMEFGELQAQYVYDRAIDKTLKFHLGVGVGDLTGESIRVGAPRMFKVSKVHQILAVINAPPLHLARYEEGGEMQELNLNYDGNSYVGFDQEESREMQFSMTTKNEWGYSEEMRASLGFRTAEVNTTMTTRYGENFTRVSTSSRVVNFSLGQPQLWKTDSIIVSETDYTVWEYPVYERPDAAPAGYLAVVFPADLEPVVSTIPANDRGFPYYPNHMVSNVLSYSEALPNDYSVAHSIFTGWQATLGDNSSGATVVWSEMEQEEAEDSSEMETTVSVGGGADVSFKGVSLGISVEVMGTYNESEMSTITTTFLKTTSVQFYFDAISPIFSYKIRPLIYWSQPWGYLKVDYLSVIPTNELFDNGWQQIYERRYDLAFSLPWLDGSHGEEAKHQTRDIFFAEREDGSVEIQVTVHNYSLRAARDFEVRVYDADPDDEKGGQEIGREVIEMVLHGRQSHNVSLNWTPPALGLYHIYAVIYPANDGDDLNHENNKGWSPYRRR